MSAVKSPVEQRARDTGKKDKIVVEKTETEELPPGWITELKVRKSGSAARKYDRHYTDPVTGYIFHSMKDVQRYLKTGEVGRLASKPKDKTSVSENDSDSCKKAVLSPLSEVSRQKRPLEDRSKLSSPSQRASKRPAGEQISSPPEPKTRQATCLAGVKVDESAPSASPTEPKTRHVARLAGVKVDESASSLMEPKTRRATRSSGIEVDATGLSLPELKPRTARRLAAVDDAPPPPSSPPEAKTCQATPPAGIETVPSPPAGTETVTSSPALPESKKRQAKREAKVSADVAPRREAKTRRATRLSGAKILTPPPSPPDSRTTRRLKIPETRNSINYENPKAEKIPEKLEGNADVDQTPNSTQEQKSTLLTPATQESSKSQELHTMLPKEDNKIIEIPMDNNHHEKQKSPVVNPTVAQNGCKMDTEPESSTNYSMNDFWTDPCIEFAVKTLTGAIPFNELNKTNSFSPSPPLEVPMEDLWTDPCIEFAVKTLTGAIPINEDPYIQDYIQHQQSASSADTRSVHNYSLPDMGMNFCQTEVLSKHYETGVNNNNINIKQDPVGSTLGNGTKGNIVFPQGNNGQCSRSRFFQ